MILAFAVVAVRDSFPCIHRFWDDTEPHQMADISSGLLEIVAACNPHLAMRKMIGSKRDEELKISHNDIPDVCCNIVPKGILAASIPKYQGCNLVFKSFSDYVVIGVIDDNENALVILDAFSIYIRLVSTFAEGSGCPQTELPLAFDWVTSKIDLLHIPPPYYYQLNIVCDEMFVGGLLVETHMVTLVKTLKSRLGEQSRDSSTPTILRALTSLFTTEVIV